jgi:hypothetical protein
MKIKKFDEFNEINEGLGNWLATGLLMVSLGLIPKTALSKNPPELKQFVAQLDTTDKDCLQFLDTLDVDTIIDFPIPLADFENKFNQFKQDTGLLSEYNTIDLLSYMEKDKNFPLKPSIIKIQAPLPEGRMITIPLYLLEYEAAENLKVTFASTGVVNSLGLTYKF